MQSVLLLLLFLFAFLKSERFKFCTGSQILPPKFIWWEVNILLKEIFFILQYIQILNYFVINLKLTVLCVNYIAVKKRNIQLTLTVGHIEHWLMILILVLILLVVLIIALLSYNFNTIPFTHWKCTISWFLIHSLICANVSTEHFEYLISLPSNFHCSSREATC